MPSDHPPNNAAHPTGDDTHRSPGGADERDQRREEVKRKADEEASLTSPTVYEIISREGIEEMERPLNSLWWSGVAAGIGISLSLFAMAALRVSLDGVPGASALEKFGYCLGFLVVVLGRLQLFTENTITPILPALRSQTAESWRCVARLWTVVLLANLVGTLVSMLIATFTPMASPDHLQAMREISAHFAHRPLDVVFFSAIPAGFMVAVMVWMMPSSKGFEFWTIVAITFAIALTDTSHVVVGSAELWLALLQGDTVVVDAAARLFLAGAGNIVGGSGLFAVLAYAQVSQEV